jgi:signal transduction histidine kinase
MFSSHQRPEPHSINYPLYLSAVLTVLFAILLINGYFEIQRTRGQLFTILETEGLLVIKGLEKNSGALISALSPDQLPPVGQGPAEGSLESLGIEDLLIERLIHLALQLDQQETETAGVPRDLEKQMVGWGIKKIYFLKPDPKDPSWAALPAPLKTTPPFFQDVLKGKTRLAVFRGSGVSRTIALSVAVARRVKPGLVVLALSYEEYLALSRQIVIQGFLEDFAGKGNIAYLKVEGPDGRVMAQAGETLSGEGHPLIWKKVVRSQEPRLLWIKSKDGEFLEIAHSFSPGGKNLGLLLLGLSLKEVSPILNQSRRSVIFMGLVLLGLGGISLFLIFRMQGRHIQRLRELEAQIRLKEDLSAMGQLAAGVAHEIKNPLNAISLVVQRLEKEFVQPDPEEQKEYEKFTRIVRSEISRVNQIIGQFLKMARPLHVSLEEQPPVAILEYVLEVLGEEIRQNHIQVHKSWPENVPMIRCDRFQLTQAFLNIIRNALEAMPQGGEIDLQVRLIEAFGSGKKGSLWLKGKEGGEKGEWIEIAIRDTGPGMAPEVLDKIFAPYYTTKEKGVGLGLAITRKIVETHKGTLAVISSEDQGTTVTIRLPASP